MRPDGTLDWTPPAGRWMVLRFGYSLLGITNHPASPEGTGLEVDKLNPGYVKAYFDDYLDQYQETRRATDGQARSAVHDHRQLGGRRAELDRRHDRRVHEAPRLRSAPWLPALTGRVVESAEATRSLPVGLPPDDGDMLAEYHYDQITALAARSAGMGRYGESHEAAAPSSATAWR